MADWPICDSGQRAVAYGEAVASTYMTAFSTSSNSKGAWTQLAATAPQNTGIAVTIQIGNSSIYRGLVDIGVGGAGSEVVVVENIPIVCQQYSYYPHLFYVPLKFPVGSRLAIRGQNGSAGTTNFYGMVHFLDRGFNHPESFNHAYTIGADVADSGGITMTADGSNHTKGAYAEIVASSSYNIKHLLVATTTSSQASPSNKKWLIDIAVGAAASEVIIIEDIYSHTGVAMHPLPISIPIDIPVGTRISARCSCETGGTTVDIVLIGLR